MTEKKGAMSDDEIDPRRLVDPELAHGPESSRREMDSVRAEIAAEAVTMVGPNGERREVFGDAMPAFELHNAYEREMVLVAKLAAADVLVAKLRDENEALKRWQAQRVVDLSQDPTCVKWMREAEAAERARELALTSPNMIDPRDLVDVLDGKCGDGRCYCGGCVL